MVDKFSSRRVLPRLAMPLNMLDNISASLLCSGDFNLFYEIWSCINILEDQEC